MADELKTVLGFEAAGAIASLNQLATSLDKYTAATTSAAGATTKFNKSAAAVDGNLKSLSSATRSYTKTQQSSVSAGQRVNAALLGQKQQLDSVKKAVKDTGDATKKAGGQMILSWQSVIRIFTIQVIHQAISKVTSALKDSVSEAIELEIKFAEIQTISTELSKDFEGVSSSVRELSDEFGVAAGIIAEGTYQTLSNQVAQGADAFRFLSAAAEFGTAAVTKTDAAVNLLSSAINSYGFAASQASTIGAKLFKTIELGRIRGEEFADTYGRVLVLGSELGVAFDEINASVATLTISGLRYNEAFTLITNVMLKLIRPTQAMKDEMREMGIVSAEAGIQAFGFQGFLEKIRERAGGTATELGELFGRVRAIRGALGLTGEAAETYEKNLLAIQKATTETLDEAKLKIFQTSAKRVSIEMERLKNAVVFDFGRGALAGIDVAIQAMGGLVAGAKAAGVAFTALAIRAAFMVRTLKFSPIIAQLAVFTGAIFIATVAWQKFTETASESAKKTRDMEREGLAAQAKLEGDLIEVQVTAFRKKASLAQVFFSDVLRTVNERRQAAFDAEAQITANFFDHITQKKGTFEDFISSVENKYKDSADKIAEIDKKLFDLAQAQAQREFDAGIKNLGDLQKSVALRKRATDLAGQAAVAARAGREDERDSLIKAGQAAAQQSVLAAEKAGNVAGIVKAQEKLNELLGQEKGILQDTKAIEQSKQKSAVEQLKLANAEIEKLPPEAQAIAIRLTGEEVKTVAQLENLLKLMPAAQKASEDQIRAVGAQRVAEEQLASALTSVNAVIKANNAELSKASELRRNFAGGAFGAPAPSGFAVGSEIFSERKEAVAVQQQLVRLTDQHDRAAKNLTKSLEGAFNPELYDSATTSLQGVMRALASRGLQQQADQIRVILENAAEAATAKEKIKFTKEAILGVFSMGKAFDDLAASTTKAAVAAERLARANAAIAQGRASRVQNNALGGMIYRATGGFTPRGTDRRLAALSVDEMVINAKSARKFQSQLIGMNSGVTPQFRRSGGAVTNIGDVNISVQGASLPAQTARETMRAFKREVRRNGTSF